MKSKNVLVSLAIALSSVASCGIAQAQIGGSPAQGDTGISSGDSGFMGQTDNMNTWKQASKRDDVQDYVSPNDPYTRQHTYAQRPLVVPMMNAGPGGLNQASTALMAPGSTSIGNTPFPSGSFSYGFPNAPIQAYRGVAPKTGGIAGAYGGMLPNVSLGSVDINTVDTSGIAPVGMGSPGRGMGAPIGRPVIQMPNSSSSTSSTLDWLQNTFFGGN